MKCVSHVTQRLVEGSVSRSLPLLPALILCSAGWVGWLWAATGSCAHTFASNRLKSVCISCSPAGPVPVNDGVRCTVSVASDLVFCDCTPDANCVHVPGVYHWVYVWNHYGGTCNRGACENPTSFDENVHYLPIRISRGCAP